MITARQAGDPLPTGEDDPTDVVGRRCVQFVLDVLVVVVPVLVIGIGGGVLLFSWAVHLVGLRAFAVTLVGSLFVLYFAGVLLTQLWWPRRRGGTPAMRWLGLRIVGVDGTRPRLPTLLVRMLLQVVDGFAFGLVGLVLMLVSPRHQRFGDVIAGTLVVREHR